MTKVTFTRLALLVVTSVIAAGALGASTATANESIELDSESPPGANCNPCVGTAGGESHINLFGVRVSTCADSFTAEAYHDGTGHISYTNGAHDSGGTCTRIACNGVGEASSEAEFDIISSEETAPNVGTMNVRFCLDTVSNPNGTGTHCTAPVAVSSWFDLHALCAGGLIEVEGAYTGTGGDSVEAVHL